MPNDLLAPLEPLKQMKQSFDTGIETAVESMGNGAPPIPQLPGMESMQGALPGMPGLPTGILAMGSLPEIPGLPPLPGQPKAEKYEPTGGNVSSAPEVEQGKARYERSY